MEVEGFRPKGSTFTNLIQSSSSLENRALGSLFHAQVLRVGLLSDVYVQAPFVGMYSSILDLESARRVFGWIVDKDVVAWNSMMFGLLKFDIANEALHLFDGMLMAGIIPTQFTYSMVLNACARLGDHHYGKLIHAQLVVLNTQIDLPLQNSLLDVYCNCGNTDAAFEIFKRMDSTDLVSWNTIISRCAEKGDEEKAIDLFVQLHKHSLPKPDEYTFTVICSATAMLPDYGKPLHAQVIKAGLGSSVFVGSILMSMYFKNCEAEAAEKVFYSVSEKDVLWSEMVTGHSRMGKADSAMKFFHEMYKEGYRIDSFSLRGALSACTDLATWRRGEMIHS